MRTFALTRLRAPEITQDRFTVPKKFNLSEYLLGSFNVFKGGDDYEVVIDFDSWAADLIRGRRWHFSQEFTELPGRQIRLRLRLNSIEEAERWVLSWGTHATVVRPQTLAARLCNTAIQLQDRYKALRPQYDEQPGSRGRAASTPATLSFSPKAPGALVWPAGHIESPGGSVGGATSDHHLVKEERSPLVGRNPVLI